MDVSVKELEEVVHGELEVKKGSAALFLAMERMVRAKLALIHILMLTPILYFTKQVIKMKGSN